MIRPLLAAFAVAAAVLPVVPANAIIIARAESVTAVPADGTTVTALATTAVGATYDVTVTGTFAYNALGGLADCRWHDANAAVAGQDWEPDGAQLLFEGSPAPCRWYTPEHTYMFTVEGTGHPFSFRIDDPTGYADNAGALTVTVVTRWDVDATCHFVTVGQPNSTTTEVLLVAEAHQTGVPQADVVLTQTSVECVLLRNGADIGQVGASATGVATGPVATRVTTTFGAFRVCYTARVFETFFGTRVERTWCP